MHIVELIRSKIQEDEYAISDHAIIEARKDGLEPQTIKKIEQIIMDGKVIEEYPDRRRVLIYGELKGDQLPVHVVVDYSCLEEPVIVTCYVPDRGQWIGFQKRKTREGK